MMSTPCNQPDESSPRSSGSAEYVSDLIPMEQQVGANVLTALQHENTVAVLSAVVVGPDGMQRIVSAPLDAERMQMVQEILESATEEQAPSVRCFGFQCKSPALNQSDDQPPDVRDDH